MLRLADQAEGIRMGKGDDAPFFRLQRTQSSNTRTFAVTSGKGGVGKTQVSANLAIGLARRGKKVLLLDADLGLASLDLALGLKPKADLMSVVEGEKTMDDILMEGPCGVQLLPACPGRYEMANLGPRERNLLSNAVDEVARRFDVLIIDTGAGIGSNAVEFAAAADEVLLVVTEDPTSLRDAYAMTKVLNRRSGVERIRMISNQVKSERRGAEIHDQLQSIVKKFLTVEVDYLGCLPFDDQVRQACAAGEPFLLRAPNSVAARAFTQLIGRLMTETEPRSLS